MRDPKIVELERSLLPPIEEQVTPVPEPEVQAKKKGKAGKIALWTGVGVVGSLGALVGLAYLDEKYGTCGGVFGCPPNDRCGDCR